MAAIPAQKGVSRERLLFFTKRVLTPEYLKEMIMQTDKTNKKFPLKGIEHVYESMKKPYEGEFLCRYCGYCKRNLMHIIKDPE